MTRLASSAIAVAFLGFASCSINDEAVETEEVASTTEAMSRCGYPPRRPWPAGCVFRCECADPVNGPFGEEPDDYNCSTGECHLEPRSDCSFELYCD
jgi:hypothetical protein